MEHSFKKVTPQNLENKKVVCALKRLDELKPIHSSEVSVLLHLRHHLLHVNRVHCFTSYNGSVLSLSSPESAL